MLIITSFKTPVGWIDVTHDEHFIYHAYFVDHPSNTTQTGELVQQISTEINTYFNDPQHRFQLPLKPQGSIYQLRVLQELLIIPAGRTLTYGALATLLQSGPRAVGQACKKNPLALFIPCHRVVGKHNVGGFMGKKTALHYKLALLKHENPAFESNFI